MASHPKKINSTQRTSAAKRGKQVKKCGRYIAIEILLARQAERKPVDLFFNRLAGELSSRDKAFVKTLVFGVLRQKEYLDLIIGRFSKHPLAKMKDRTLVTLEIGAYQLLFLDRIPSSAAVHATVDTLKQTRQPKWLQGFVNGLLRNVSRNKDNLPSPETAQKNEKPVLNHPSWLVERWQRQFGENSGRQICVVNNREPSLTLRVNTHKTTRKQLQEQLDHQGILNTCCQYSPIGLQLPTYSGLITELPGFEQGFFQIQDESAQLATILLGPLHERKRILDGCAGLGGKTSHILQESEKTSEVVAVEPDKRRFRLLQDNILRLQLGKKTSYICSTLEEYAKTRPALFDAILLDAPCSGTGVIRRNPDIRWNRRAEDFGEFQKTQSALLKICGLLLAPGGRLVYATCSLEPEENERVVSAFLDECTDFTLIDARSLLPDSAHELVTEDGFFQPLPTATHDGFFAAAITRRTNL